MRELNVYYSKLQNMGDQLNPLLIEKCFGYPVKRCSFLDGELCAIGSCLGQYLPHGSLPMKLQQKINGIRSPKVAIWGTGFVDSGDAHGHFFKRDMRFCAVRGELTRKNVERMTGKKLDIPTGDAGILISELFAELPEKCYEIGIVPHLCDRNDPLVQELLKKYPNAKLIDVKEEPMEVLTQIAQCRLIISSSLHGLIAADSLGIPNMHIVFGDRLLGDGYKFEDYYSAYELTDAPWDLRSRTAPTFDEIRQGYRLTERKVSRKKKEMREAFPFPQKGNETQ